MEGLRRLRETKGASGMNGARGRCGGWQRGFVRLRRVKEEVREMGFCACVEVGLRRGFSLLCGDGLQSLQHACVRLPFRERTEFRTVKQSRPLLVAVATA